MDGWDGCSGYHYSDSIIYGFSHTHLSGTGVSDYADVLLMPITGQAVYSNTDYASAFSHNNEVAEAGYYKVKLDKHNILAELTTSQRTGMHKYSFLQKKGNKIILDLNHRDVVLDAYLEQVDDYTLKGYRISKAWAQKQSTFFYIQFSEKISNLEINSNDSIFSAQKFKSTQLVASIGFGKMASKELMVKVGISFVDMNGAEQNLKSENPNWDFEAFKAANQNQWREELSSIQISDDNESKKTVFYTALYHNLIVPNMFSDVDGRYRGMDDEIHKSATNQYTIFSLWDTYRATHPLYTIIETERAADFIATFKNQYNDGGILPIWELAGNYTGCMIGYHAIPVIADAYFKGITDIPVDTLLEMVLKSANQDNLGLKAYKEFGFISNDDWCIAQLAKAAGKDSVYKVFIARAQSYKNILDTKIGYMRPKLNQIWKAPFDPSEVDFNYTEANSWQYSFYVPQDMYSFMDLLGGEARFEQQLDDLFSASSVTSGRHQSDITGLIGQYAHGNEPSHHMAYLYNYVNKSQKTQSYVHRIVNELYTDQPDGLCGNEDCGQMSAWYVFSTMGFYPVNPANGEYVFGKPFFKKVQINLENGKKFIIEKTGEESAHAFLSEILLNGEKYTKAYINHKDIMNGGVLTFKMSNKNPITYASGDMPNSKIVDGAIIPVPAIRTGKSVFRDTTSIIMESIDGAKVMYSINGSEEKEYVEPILIDSITTISMRSLKEGKTSKTLFSKFYKIPEGRHITLD
ncbi:MAG: glycosyl hydrolase family 92 [Bacteroidetes bacterium 4572_77]|nr:MAG: glycosyl hydrolase family 92 [Bacteroidetes bacterium 4572_77]